MIRKILSVTIVTGFAAALTAPAIEKGAKELFYDPVDATVTSVTPSAAPKQPAPSGVRVAPKAARPAAAVPLDQRGRRQVNLPVHASTGVAARASGISYWIELVGTGGGPGAQVANNRIFHSGERIRLHFRSNVDGNIALIQLGASGTSRVLFPDPLQGLADSRLSVNDDRILPSENHWFRFDDNPGTERLIILFARQPQELDRFAVEPRMGAEETGTLMANVQRVKGSKDLFVETETRTAGEVGTYGVNVSGQPVVLELSLEHR